LRSGADLARPQAATTRPLQHGQYALSPWRTGPGCEPENGEMGSGSQRFPECAHTRPTGRRRQIQPGICKEEVGGPEKATGQAGPETAAAGPEPGQPGSTKARPAIRLIEATAEPATKAGFQTARPATAAAEPAGKCRQPGAETAGTGKAKQAASKREKRRQGRRKVRRPGRSKRRAVAGADDRAGRAISARFAKGIGTSDDFCACATIE